MKFLTEFPLNMEKLNKTILYLQDNYGTDQVILSMNSQTVMELNGKSFSSIRKQTFDGFKIIEDRSLDFGEIKIFIESEVPNDD